MMLEQPEVPDAVPGRGAGGPRDRGRQPGIVIPAAAIASVVVAVVAVAAYMVSPNGSGAGNLSSALGGLQNSKSVTLLAQERQQIVVMNQAASTMATAAKPTVVSPTQIKAQQPQPEAASTSTSTSTSSSGTSSGSSSSSSGSSSGSSSAQMDSVPTGEASPEEAKQIAQELMGSFGFSVSSQWECLDEVWTKESSWEWDAENPSGAYGIPQALPASKMASAGSDYMTDAATQIKWGLGYISSTYGTPCNAWAHEVNDGWY